MVTFPIDLPSTPGFVQSTLIPVTTNKGTRSPLSAKQKVLNFDGDHWDLSFTLPIMSRTQAAPWQAALASLRGNFGTFWWYDRYQTDVQGSVTQSQAFVDGAGQVGSVLNIDGLPVSTSGVLLAGDKFGLDTDPVDELKMVLEDVDSDVLGEAAVSIWPPLNNSPADGLSINIGTTPNLPKGAFRLLSPSAFPVSGIGNYEITVNATEAI